MAALVRALRPKERDRNSTIGEDERILLPWVASMSERESRHVFFWNGVDMMILKSWLVQLV